MINPPRAVADVIDSQNTDMDLGRNLFLGLVLDSVTIPDNVVFVHEGTGREPELSMGMTYEIRYPIVHVRLRDRSYEYGYETFRRIIDNLAGTDIPGFGLIQALYSDPDIIDVDEKDRFNWLMSYQLIYNQING